ncbi:MAG: VOC family protein [Candidatus Kariarchaeaceae archaeon]|jgi:predicted enzyme related to lactoylglutathione lyase
METLPRPKLNDNKPTMLITFIYYKDLQQGIDFYQNFLGFPLAIDQGFCKIYRISESGYIGIVDEEKGMHKTHPIKPVQICLRVPDVDAFYEYVKSHDVDGLSEISDVEALKIRAFVFNDPEGYQIEIQQSTGHDFLL